MAEKLDKKLVALLKSLPGYDPFKGADDFYFDLDLAQRAVRFIETACTFTAGEKAGQPFLLEPWQKAIVLNIFGWYKKTDGLRRFREAFIFVPRKNGKTELAAAIALCVMFIDNEAKAEIYSAGADREQAKLVFTAAKTMILQNRDFKKHAKVYVNTITRVQNGIESASYKAISADANTKHGYRGHCILIDELHAHRDSELMDTLITSTGSRREPLVIIITTSDYERENSPCNQKHKYACGVRDGEIEDMKFLPVIYEASIEDDWTKEEVWRKANPNYEVSLYKEYMESECSKAKQNPSYENVFKRLHLNIRTETQSRLFDIAKWDSCTDRLPLEEYEGQFCYGGLDLGATSDLTSLCLVFKRMDALDIFDYYWWHWTPRHDIIARGRKHGIDYMALSDIGELTLSAGNEADYAAIHRDINELGDRFSIKSLAVDRLFQGAQLAQQLQCDGFPIEIMGQGFYSMTAPTQEFMKRINKGTIAHGNTRIMRWQATNTQAKLDPAGNIKPDKAKSGNKIDGIVSAIMATAMACQDQWRSSYDREDVII